MSLKSLAKLSLLASAAPLLLSACSFNDPGPMPAGYTYHQGTYKTIPGSEPRDLGFDYSQALSAESEEYWREATRDLAVKIVLDAGVAGKPVYLEPPKHETPLTRTMDNYLREALTNVGFGILSAPGAGPTIRYNAELYQPEEDRQVLSADADSAAPVPPAASPRERVLTSSDRMVLAEPLTPTELAGEPPAPTEKFVPAMPENPQPGSVVMTLQVVEGDMLLAHESGVYPIPELATYRYQGAAVENPAVIGPRESGWPIPDSFRKDEPLLPAPKND